MEEIMSPENISQLGLDIANKFRLGHEATANKLLVNFIDQIQLIPIEENKEENKEEKVAQLIEVMCLAQQRSDNLFLADILQYELLPTIITILKNSTVEQDNGCSEPSENINKTESATNERLTTNQHGEMFYYSANRNSFNNKSSSTVFSQHFQQRLFQEDNFYIISGTDSGLLIPYVDTHFPQGSMFVFIELPEYLEYAQHLAEQARHSDNIKVSSIDTWLEDAIDMKLDSYIYLRNFEFFKSIAANDLFNIHYHSLNSTAESLFQEHIFRLSAALGGFEFSQQQLLNLAENIYPADLLEGTQKDKTCIILAGGPSLDESLDWIKTNRNKLLVIAVSRISKCLISANLIPDIIVSVDPKHNSFEVSREMLLFPETPLFVHMSNVNSGLLSQWQGKSAYISDMMPWDSPLNATSFEGEGPTVTNTAISLAMLMKVKTILLAGVDLCLSKRGVSHASGSVEAEITGANLAFIGEKVQTYSGEIAQTTIQMAIAVKMIDHQAKCAKEQGIDIFNLSENASKAEHILHKPTKEIELIQASTSFQSSIANIYPTVSNDMKKEHINTVLKEVTKWIFDCEKIKSLAEKALNHNEKSFDEKLSLEAQHQHKLKMDKIEKQLDKKFSKHTPFLKKFGLRFFIQCIQTKDAETWDNDTIKKTGQIYYQAYINSCKLLSDRLNQTQKRLIARLEELSPQPSINKIIAQLELDNQPGRALIIKKQLKGKLTQEDDDKLNQQIKKFDELFQADTEFSKKLAKVSPLKGIRTKILLLVSQKDISSLNQLAQGLQELSVKDEQAIPLYYLAQAYLLMLNEQYEQALMAFEEVGSENLKEDELTQIASIALKLKMSDLAESALSMLTSFNDSFIPKYAHFLKVTGKPQQAIDSYLDYLSKRSEDINSWIALGNIFIEIDAKESAVMAFQEVIARDPNNSIAHSQLNALEK